MAPKKLTEADKAAILGLYRQPEETTSTLAERYGVSNSTISRLLKSSLPEADYKSLIQQKRGSVDRDPGSAATVVVTPASPEVSPPSVDLSPEPADVTSASTGDSAPQSEATKAPPILKKRTATAQAASDLDVAPDASSTEDLIPQDAPSAEDDLPTDDLEDTPATPRTSSQSSSRRRRSRSRSDDNEEATQLALSTEGQNETLTEEPSEPVRSAPAGPIKKAAPVAKAEEADSDDDWEDPAATLGDDYADEDDDDDEDDAWDGDPSDLAPHLEAVEITPLTPSDLPSQCYLVVERVSSELVVLPLKTFASLGQIPEEEGDLRTLPVFDNHHVARRFSRRNQRVIKVPDGNLLQTTRPYLQAKGITRLLIDGHVFALEDKVEVAP